MLPALDRQTERAWRTSIIAPFVDEWRTTVTEPESNDN